MINSKKWSIGVLGLSSILVIGIALFVFCIDPYFHYHAPFEEISYVMEEEQYMNDGIAKNFSYDAAVVGTSMVRDFSMEKTNELFGVTSVKLMLQGEGFKRLAEITETAISHNSNLKLVIRSIDPLWFTTDVEYEAYESYPEYLYDEELWNDFYYLLNGDVLVNRAFPQLIRTLRKVPARDFDDYINIGSGSRERVLAGYDRSSVKKMSVTEEETKNLLDALYTNIHVNIVDTVKKHPEISFYFFFPPYSICWWDQYNLMGPEVMERRFLMEELVIEELIPFENIHLFSFNTNYALICNLDNYTDTVHYSGEIGNCILEWMKNGEYELTEENYKEYIQDIKEFYENFDYNLINSTI